MSIPPFFQPNTIYCGDCRDILRKFPEKSVDLIYADPPFFSNKKYEVIWKDGYEILGFEDRWKGGINNYITWMEERLVECYYVLKDTGSMYLHCDWHASHYLKVLMDRIFGYKNFRNSIIWERSHSRSTIRNIFRRAHDDILFYSKTNDYNFNIQYRELSETSKKIYSHEDEIGIYQHVPLLVSGIRKGKTGEVWRGIDPNKHGRNGMHWITLPENLDKYDEEGRVYWPKKVGGQPRLKYYLKDSKGVPVNDVWTDIDIIESSSSESLGFPTQKPEELIKRIINASSNPMDIVLDPFCGCGTAIAVSHKLNRRWIGIDISPTSCKLMFERMRTKVKARDIHLVGMPMTLDALKKLDPFEFQNWVIQRLYGRVSTRKTSDMGIDGYTYEGYPVQVKQSESIGRNIVDNFQTAIRRSKKKKGLIVAFSFGRGAYEEIARAKNEEGLEIEAVTVEELLKNRRNRLVSS